MRKVKVTFLHSPRRKYGLALPKGSTNFIPLELAKRIRKEDPNFFVSAELDALEEKKERPSVVKDTAMKKTRTRPVSREKDS